MGRIRIKKKGRVLPFRETVAYRFIIVATASILFVIAVYQFFSAWAGLNSTGMIISGLAALGSGFLGVYNFNRMQTARIPKQTLQRMKRR